MKTSYLRWIDWLRKQEFHTQPILERLTKLFTVIALKVRYIPNSWALNQRFASSKSTLPAQCLISPLVHLIVGSSWNSKNHSLQTTFDARNHAAFGAARKYWRNAGLLNLALGVYVVKFRVYPEIQPSVLRTILWNLYSSQKRRVATASALRQVIPWLLTVSRDNSIRRLSSLLPKNLFSFSAKGETTVSR